MEEDVPYRSGISIQPAEVVSSQDELDYSTLLLVKRELDRSIAELDAIHVFDLKEDELTIKEQVAAYSKARDVLLPLQAIITGVVNEVSLKLKEGYAGR